MNIVYILDIGKEPMKAVYVIIIQFLKITVHITTKVIAKRKFQLLKVAICIVIEGVSFIIPQVNIPIMICLICQ